MKNLMQKNGKTLMVAIGLVLGLQNQGQAQGTAFTYQGRLNFNGGPASGNYDFRFEIATDAKGSNVISSPFATNGVPVTNGLFCTTLDFGPGIFAGGNLWLQIEVKTNGAAGYATLNPLQSFTPTPYAIYANTASNVSGTVSAAQIGGTLLNSSLPASPVFSGAVAANAFSGNGASVTNVNAVGLNGLSATNFWQLGGNAVSTGQFFGSTNNQAVEFWTAGVRALRMEPDPRGLNAANLIGGWPSNSVSPVNSGGDTIAGGGFGGGPNQVLSNSSGIFIGAGSANQVGPNVNDSLIAGGYGNAVQSPDALIVGGSGNIIQSGATGSLIGGGTANSVHTNASGATIGGGYGNEISEINAFIGGGVYNVILAGAGESVVAGGYDNSVQSVSSSIGGGEQNVIEAGGDDSIIAGGAVNLVQTNSSGGVIGGGLGNTVGNTTATVPGGFYNSATGNASFAAGTYAQAVHNGAFVLADSSHLGYFFSTAADQLSARFQGGVRFVTSGAGLTLDGSPVLVSGGAGNGNGLTGLNASQLTAGIVPLAALSGLTGAQLSALTWQLATNLDGGKAMLASNVVSGINITNAFITNSTFAGNGGGLTNLNASQISGGTLALAQLPGVVVTNNGNGLNLAGTFTGNGVSLTNVNAVSLGGKFVTNFWQTGGNAGTSPANGNFLGTTDNQPLELRANNVRALRLEPTGSNAVNVIGGFGGNFVAANVVGAGIGAGGAGGYTGSVYSNSIGGDFGWIGGGRGNQIGSGSFDSTLGGGLNNAINAYRSTIGGGDANVISAGGLWGAISGGGGNSIQSNSVYGSIMGGSGNQILNGRFASISGGIGNAATGPGAVAGGGGVLSVSNIFTTYFGNLAGGLSSVTVGGVGNRAMGGMSLAAGNLAYATHDGSFVWADSSAYLTYFYSTTSNEFSIRAQNGVRIQSDVGIHLNAADEPLIVRDWDVFATNAPSYKAGIGRWGLFMEPTVLTLGIPADDVTGRLFQVAKYNTNGTPTALLQVNQAGTVTASNFVATSGLASPKWNVTNLVNTIGPLSKTNSFTTGGGTLVIFASGSGYSATAGASIGMDIKLDGTLIDSCLIFANPSLTHMAFVPKTLVKTGVAPGAHTLSLSARTGTTTDATDNFCVTVQELPF